MTGTPFQAMNGGGGGGAQATFSSVDSFSTQQLLDEARSDVMRIKKAIGVVQPQSQQPAAVVEGGKC